mgnify:CR=1 FL=1
MPAPTTGHTSPSLLPSLSVKRRRYLSVVLGVGRHAAQLVGRFVEAGGVEAETVAGAQPHRHAAAVVGGEVDGDVHLLRVWQRVCVCVCVCVCVLVYTISWKTQNMHAMYVRVYVCVHWRGKEVSTQTVHTRARVCRRQGINVRSTCWCDVCKKAKKA